jgi:hypothetical protein
MDSFSTFNIHFIRDENSKSEDDKLVVTPYFKCGEVVFNVEYQISKNQYKNNKISFNSKTLKKSELQNYIYILFNLVSNDDSPYAAYQIDLPLMPSIYIKHENLTKVLGNIYSHIETLVVDWPIRTLSASTVINELCNPFTDKTYCNSHKIFDEDGVTIADE